MEHARYKVHVLPCIGGSLVLMLLHVLVLYSTEAEIGHRRTRSYQPWTSLLQDRTGHAYGLPTLTDTASQG
jgi:hypothetical protein